jgi:predicted O-methyltransferase YrrM
MEKLRTLFWFLKRPRLYPELTRILSGKVFRADSLRDENPQEAADWCQKLRVPTERAFELLIGNKSPAPVDLLFPGYFENAERIQHECPFQMGGPGELDILYWSAEHLQATRVIETGVAYGWSSLAILLSLHNRKESQLISTDMPYPNMNNDSYVGCIVPGDLRRNWQIIRYADRQALPKAIKKLPEIDLCHYDSDKSFQGRMWAYPILWNVLRRGGILISDDIGDNMAFIEFSGRVGRTPIVVKKDYKYIGIIIKPLNGYANGIMD